MSKSHILSRMVQLVNNRNIAAIARLTFTKLASNVAHLKKHVDTEGDHCNEAKELRSTQI